MFGTGKLINQYEDRLKELKLSYEERIADLKGQIADLRSLVISPTSARNIPILAMEADAVISGQQDVIQISDQEEDLNELAISERDRILSGNY